jgi:hypothetical protein
VIGKCHLNPAQAHPMENVAVLPLEISLGLAWTRICTFSLGFTAHACVAH